MNTFIFDLDGVLVDTAKYHYLAWKKISDKYNFTFDIEMNEKLKGVSRNKCLDIIIEASNKKIDETVKEYILKEKNDIYLSLIDKLNPNEVLPGVIDVLDFAKKNGINVCLGSASKNAKPILDKVYLSQYFDCVVDGTDVSKAKPDPEVFIKGAARLGVSPFDCIVFEDSEAGVEAAYQAGMKSVGIGDKDLLSRANIVVNNLEEIELTNIFNI